MATVVLKLGNDISTDVIYPGRYMATVLPTETPQFAFADNVPFNSKLNSGSIPKGSVVLAGENFGCGSSREQAVSTLKGHELVIIARSVARIFLQNAINLGLNIIQVPDMEASEGDEVEIKDDTVTNVSTGKGHRIRPLPKARQVIIDAGGLIPYTRKRVVEQGKGQKQGNETRN